MACHQLHFYTDAAQTMYMCRRFWDHIGYVINYLVSLLTHVKAAVQGSARALTPRHTPTYAHAHKGQLI